MRILIVTDAWFPQVNGVVRTLDTTAGELRRQGHEVSLVTPETFRTIPCPTYPEIRLALAPRRQIARTMESVRPQAVHIATEGPLGLAARRICLDRRLPFTTAFHTRFPEYVHARVRLPLSLGYAAMRRFHGPAVRTMVATKSLQDDLRERGFEHLATWGRGVDVGLFRPEAALDLDLPRPIHLYVGRVAVEKNIQAFLDLPLDGSKLVVGDGPQIAMLRRNYPDVHFVGAKFGEDLAAHYAASDVFVFPSLTDTFGLVLLEALASGVPVAAYPVTGPRDLIAGTRVGVLDEDLARAVAGARNLERGACRDFALAHSWQASAEQFFGNLAPIDSAALAA